MGFSTAGWWLLYNGLDPVYRAGYILSQPYTEGPMRPQMRTFVRMRTKVPWKGSNRPQKAWKGSCLTYRGLTISKTGSSAGTATSIGQGLVHALSAGDSAHWFTNFIKGRGACSRERAQKCAWQARDCQARAWAKKIQRFFFTDFLLMLRFFLSFSEQHALFCSAVQLGHQNSVRPPRACF